MRVKHGICAVLALAMCVCCTLALGITRAKADGNNTINVLMPKEDLEDNVDINIYRVASAVWNGTTGAYDYVFDVDAFKGLIENNMDGVITEADWETMTKAAGAIVASPEAEIEHETIRTNETIKITETTGSEREYLSGSINVSDGLYLIYMEPVTIGSKQYSSQYSLRAVPGKVNESGEPLFNTAEGRWTNEDPQVPVKVYLKPIIDDLNEDRYGSLKIIKHIKDFVGEAATFVYHIVDQDTGGEVYENYAAVQFTEGEQQSTLVEHIPAGLVLVVTEVYTGARYELVSAKDQIATIEANATAIVEFENKYKDTGTQGHGIENHFVLSETDENGKPLGEDGDWIIDVRYIDASEYSTKESEDE